MTRHVRRLLQTRRRRLVVASGLIGLMGAQYSGIPAQRLITGALTLGLPLLLLPLWRLARMLASRMARRMAMLLALLTYERPYERLAYMTLRVMQSGRDAALYPRFLARSLTGVAALLAGRKRSAVRDEWNAHLAGENGHDPITWPKAREALGFVASAVQCRLADAADMAWRPADAVLGSRFLSNLFVWGPVIAVLVAIVHHDGRFGLVADDQDPAALGAFLYGAIRTGRWWRGVKPPEPKARHARE
jgi:hypothetical protein